MRCPACNSDNPSDSGQCAACGEKLTRRRKPARKRAVPEETDSPFSSKISANNWPAVRAYRFAVWGLIPALGALLGPVAVVLGLRAMRRGKKDPEFTAKGVARAAVVLGTALALTNWAGLVLIYLGLR